MAFQVSPSDGARSASTGSGNEPDPLVGRVLDRRYRMDAVLGAGGVGVVYRGTHTHLNRPVAIKVLHPHFGEIEDLRRRFEREAKALSTLAHPNIVAISDYGIADGMPYLAMELLEGRTLAELLDGDGPPEPDVAIDIVRQILRGLAFAHTHKIVHRDLKPANVFLVALPDAPNHVKLLDFGLAKVFSLDEDQSPNEPTLTKMGTILGTPAYMSPEQAAGVAVDERTDVYAVGVLFFELLTGRFPFDGETRADILRAHIVNDVPHPSEVRPGLEVSHATDALIRRAMAKNRAGRFADGTSMLAAVDALERPIATVHVVTEAVSSVRQKSERSENPTLVSSSRPSGRRSAAPSKRSIVGVALALMALVGSLAGLWFLREATAEPDPPVPAGRATRQPSQSGSSKREPQAPRAVPPSPPPQEAPTATPPAPIPNRPPARETLILRTLPRELRSLAAQAIAGHTLNASQLRRLRGYQRDHRDDARPFLILGHDFANRDWFTSAIERYERAITMDPSVRGDTTLQRQLLRMARTQTAGTKASDAIVAIYGPEILPMLDRAIARADGDDPEELARLVQLRDRLRGH